MNKDDGAFKEAQISVLFGVNENNKCESGVSLDVHNNRESKTDFEGFFYFCSKLVVSSKCFRHELA